MDVLAELALTTLDSAVNTLLPAIVPAGLNRQVMVMPTRIRPSGLGGYIGTHPEPRGSIQARRLEAIVRLDISGGAEAAAGSYLNQVIRNLLAHTPAELRQLGIFRLALSSKPVTARAAQLDLSYEYRHLPTASEGIIDTIDLNSDLNSTPYGARYQWGMATRTLVDVAQPLADFFIANDPDLNAGSPAPQWTFNNALGRIEQTSSARGGPLDLIEPKKAGPQLLWRPQGNPLPLQRFIAAIEFDSSNPDGIGLIFARADADNFYYFLASQRHRYHLFGRKQGGNYSILGTPATDVGFGLNSRQTFKLTIFDQNLIAELNGTQTLRLTTDDVVGSGELGFLTHGNNTARFYRARLIELY